MGYGGLFNEEGILEMDVVYMDGDIFVIGVVVGIIDVKNLILVVKVLSKEKFNSFCVGVGVMKYLMLYGFERKNMLIECVN